MSPVRILAAPVRSLLALLALLLVASPAAAAENVGAGASMGFGFAGYHPAPGVGFRLALPALEIAGAPGGSKEWQVRARVPLLNTIYAAALRQQLDLQADLFLLKLGQCDCPVGNHVLRPIAGPMAGARLNVAPKVAQPGIALGGRFGVEYLGPQRRIGLTIAAEPFFELKGGSAGTGRSALTTGGGALLVLALTGYQAP